jgi:hypothetical protein
MLRSFASVIPALVLSFAFGGSALAGSRGLSPQQKSAATRQFQAKAHKQFGPNAGKAKVTYTGRKAAIDLVGVGGVTGRQPNTVVAVGSGKVTIHEKPSVIKAKGKTSASLDRGRYDSIYYAF